jgi:hypothetical protein
LPIYALFGNNFLQSLYYLEGGDIFVTQYAFHKLAELDVDAIYWFADFEDGIAEAPAVKVLRTVKGWHIKVYINNFSGNADYPGMKFARQLAKETGGTVTVGKK